MKGAISYRNRLQILCLTEIPRPRKRLLSLAHALAGPGSEKTTDAAVVAARDSVSNSRATVTCIKGCHSESMRFGPQEIRGGGLISSVLSNRFSHLSRPDDIDEGQSLLLLLVSCDLGQHHSRVLQEGR